MDNEGLRATYGHQTMMHRKRSPLQVAVVMDLRLFNPRSNAIAISSRALGSTIIAVFHLASASLWARSNALAITLD